MTKRSLVSTTAVAFGVGRFLNWRALSVRLFGASGILLQQFGRYVVVGGIAFVMDIGSLYVLTEFAGFHYLHSAAVAFLLGLVTNYCLCRLWVFDRRTVQNASLEFVIFAVIGIVGLGLNEAIMWVASEALHLHYLAGKMMSAGIVLLWNFGARKLILFR